MAIARQQTPWWAPWAFCLVGLVAASVGGWHVVWHHVIESETERVVGVVTHVFSLSGTTRWAQYRFQDGNGTAQEGRSSGYSGVVGESIALEYARSRPGFHRVAGEGKRPATRWRWAILGAGLVFLVAGLHTGWVTFRRTRG